LLCDILWADPEEDIEDWSDHPGSVSYSFSKQIVNNFNRKNNIELICRGHQVLLY